MARASDGTRRVASQRIIVPPKEVAKPTETKRPPVNAVSIPHNPGAISERALIDARANQKPVEDIITAQVVGNNFRSGEIIVRDGGRNKYNVKVGVGALRNSFSPSGRGGSTPYIVIGQTVVISRSRSQSGERTIRLLSVVPLGKNPRDVLARFAGHGNVNDLCAPQSGGIPSTPENPPNSPEDQEQPPPEQENDPSNPEPDDPPSKPFGCNPNDNAQWYEGENCPAGMRSLGIAVLTDKTMSLCTGPVLPPGDGCPQIPDTYGWACVGGSCQFVQGGGFSTKGECEAAGCRTFTWNCQGGNCVEAEGGTYLSLAECQEACTVTWDFPPEGLGMAPCVPVQGSGGQFTSESSCNLANGTEDRPAGYQITVRDVVGLGEWASCNPNYQNRTFTVRKINNLSAVCCIGSLGSNSTGLYGSWVTTGGVLVTNSFLVGSCGGGVIPCPNVTCGPNFPVIISIQPL